MQLNSKDVKILSHLRKNAREKLTRMSRKTFIPVSTICDRIKQCEGTYVKKHTAILDFAKLGFTARAFVMIRCHKIDRVKVGDLLMQSPYVNMLVKINNGFDFLFEAVFKTMNELEGFIEYLESFNILEHKVYYTIKEMKRESFLAEPDLSSVYGITEGSRKNV